MEGSRQKAADTLHRMMSSFHSVYFKTIAHSSLSFVLIVAPIRVLSALIINFIFYWSF